jgi:hypothetical protein
MVDDDDVLDEHHGGADCQSAAAGQVLGPGHDAGSQLERVEVDVAHGEDGRAEAVLTGVVFLDDQAMSQERPDDAVHRRGRQAQSLRDVSEAEPVVTLQDSENPQGTID